MSDNRLILKKVVDWSLLIDGLALPREVVGVFGKKDSGILLSRGEFKYVTFIMNQKKYKVKVVNVNNKAGSRKDSVFQIRYSGNSEFAIALQSCFNSSFELLKAGRDTREPGDRKPIKLPEDKKEYLSFNKFFSDFYSKV